MREIICFFLAVSLLFSCNKKKKEDPDPSAYVLDIPAFFGDKYDIPADNPLTNNGVLLGRYLFYDKMLSLDSSVSCASCHRQELAFTDGKAFSDGVQGKKASRSSMSIANMIFQNSFFWEGRSHSLEHQALFPIENPDEMNLSLDQAIQRLKSSPFYLGMFSKAFGTSEITRENIAKALSQFERTLLSTNSKYDQYKLGKYTLSAQELRGEQLFYTHPDPFSGLRGGNCGDCHSGVLTMSNQFNNNGLESDPKDIGRQAFTGSVLDKGKFRPPTLRNIALTAPYMHDGRFKTLEEVLDHYNDHIKPSPTLDPLIIEATNEVNGTSLKLTNQEKEDIIAFLKLLTDESFITNPKFSDPKK